MNTTLDVWFDTKPTFEQARSAAKELGCTIRARYPGDRYDAEADQARRADFERAVADHLAKIGETEESLRAWTIANKGAE